MVQDRFWTKSYDSHVKDMNPDEWEISFAKAIQTTFDQLPNKMALEYLGVELTFSELDQYSNKFADFLRKQGLNKGDCIALNLPNTPQYIIALIAATRLGCPVTGVSPLLSADQMLYQLNDSKAKALVTLDAIFAGHLVKIVDRLPDLQLVVTTSVGDFLSKIKQFLGKLVKKIPTGKVTPLEGKSVIDFMKVIKNIEHSTSLPQVNIDPDDLLFLLYTGGTTGPPKGAMLTNRNIVSDMLLLHSWLSWERGKGIALSGFPFFHIAGTFFSINCIYLGWSQILIPNPRDTDQICKGIEKYRPTCLVNVPSLFQMLLANPKFRTLDHSQLDTCITAAAPFPKESQKDFESVVGSGKLLEMYGMTETSPITTANPYRGVKKLGTIGIPVSNTDLKLVDPSTGLTVEIGEPGEICVKGPQVMKGYWNKPNETKNTIDDDGYLHTGDVAVFDEDGYLTIVDRTKDMIIVGGFKVFSTKLEDNISQHPAVEMVATVGIPNPDRPGSEFVKAYVAVSPDYEFENYDSLENELKDWLRSKVSPYEVPKLFVFREDLPLTLVGKVDKKALRKENA
ncbi:MAG: AMP-binding protein [Candidatus Hodarchaeales archaeon]